MIKLFVQNKFGRIKRESHGEKEMYLYNTAEYEEGDVIILEIEGDTGHYYVQLDDALGKSLVYLTDDLHFDVPFGEKHISYSPKAFVGNRHLLYVKKADENDISTYRNLAENVYDQHGNTNYFPHASANVETRGEAIFAARNVIDGLIANHSHGEWPYTSWGINRQDDAYLRLEFGRMVEIDKLVIYERADFPHDNWWKQITVEYSDGDISTINLIKTDQGQVVKFPTKAIEWLILRDLIKADDPSPFPALTQIRVYGKG